MIIQANAERLPLPDECVQCVVTSPPYWGLRKYAGEQGETPFGLEASLTLYVVHTLEILREIRRTLRPDGVVFWNIGDSYASSGGQSPQSGKLFKGRTRQRENICLSLRGSGAGLKSKDLCLIPEHIAIAAQSDGWYVRSMIIWAKPNPMPESCKDRPTSCYEHIIMLTKAEHYYWDFAAVQEPCSGNAHARGNGVNPKALLHNATRVDRAKEGHKSVPTDPSFSAAVNEIVHTRNIRNVWTFPTQAYTGAHFATFPEEIPRRCIVAASRVGDFVLDPFGGSGTTARVAIELSRRPISIDLAYHDHAEKRTRNVQRRLVTAEASLSG